ncbi:hypothetical protein RSOLAG1IB_12115 [Rhizoctonia solani AG-1 IB]|uniref:Uncharacterized protein n=1 Tax=Thanatephorus cucumeris (strain AG1-IB / isolate 7/3/14) TaxID=1108050 RepID=A0A0B7FK60_THACB|nr:hypothetical protein RSOLAG1IB_12115 [Rhizoctonia solani AG-1 IB]
MRGENVVPVEELNINCLKTVFDSHRKTHGQACNTSDEWGAQQIHKGTMIARDGMHEPDNAILLWPIRSKPPRLRSVVRLCALDNPDSML